MLYNNAGGLRFIAEFRKAIEGCIRVIDVVVGELLALNLCGAGDAFALIGAAVEGGRLVGVFTIPQGLKALAANGKIVRRGVAEFSGKPLGDCSVIGGGSGEGLGCQQAARCFGGVSAMGIEFDSTVA